VTDEQRLKRIDELREELALLRAGVEKETKHG